MTEFSDKAIGSEATTDVSRTRTSGSRLGRLLIGALAAVSIPVAAGAVPGIGSAAYASAGDPGVPSVDFGRVNCERYQMNAYSPVIRGFDATPGVVDSQYVDYRLQLEVQSGSTWQPVPNIKSYVSGYFVVNDGTGIVKDVTVPGLRSFLIPGAGTYRVATTVWWTITGTPVTAGTTASAGNWFGPVTRAGDHFRATDVAYLLSGQACSYEGDALWVADPNGPTIWPGGVYCDGAQVHAYDPTIIANDATGPEDYQQVVYRVELQLLGADKSWQTVANANFVSGRFVVNDGTGTVKDASLPGYQTFNFPNPATSATYRVQTTVWWTIASTSPTFGTNVTWSVTEKPGPHYLAGLIYRYVGLQCEYTAPVAVPIGS